MLSPGSWGIACPAWASPGTRAMKRTSGGRLRSAQLSHRARRNKGPAGSVPPRSNTFGTSACANGVSGAATDCRGADDALEFARQGPKTVAAITGTGADVIGVTELENDGYGPDSAIAVLVDELNTATAPGTYAFIDADAGTGQTNALGTDAIKVGFLYKPAKVTPVGFSSPCLRGRSWSSRIGRGRPCCACSRHARRRSASRGGCSPTRLLG